jgi:hypothetical protein
VRMRRQRSWPAPAPPLPPPPLNCTWRRHRCWGLLSPVGAFVGANRACAATAAAALLRRPLLRALCGGAHELLLLHATGAATASCSVSAVRSASCLRRVCQVTDLQAQHATAAEAAAASDAALASLRKDSAAAQHVLNAKLAAAQTSLAEVRVTALRCTVCVCSGGQEWERKGRRRGKEGRWQDAVHCRGLQRAPHCRHAVSSLHRSAPLAHSHTLPAGCRSGRRSRRRPRPWQCCATRCVIFYNAHAFKEPTHGL